MLKISIYNRQELSSKSGKTYIGYACVWRPGQAGRLTDAEQKPPFYIRDQRGSKQWIKLAAQTITEGKAEAKQAQDILDAEQKGLTVAESEGLKDENRLTVKIAKYINEIEANKSKATFSVYNRTLELFQESCKRLNVADVRRDDLLVFKTFLKRQDFEGRSVYNHFLNITVFLKWAGHSAESIGIKKHDWPPKPEREPEEYTETEIKKMLEAASKTFRGIEREKGEKNDDRLLLNSFLCTGLRDQEMAHLSYDDINVDHSLWLVRPKNGHNLKTKESQRSVPAPEWLTKRIMNKKKTEDAKDDDLIFPNTQGRADQHLVRIVKRVAKLAGVTGRIDDHKFRSTAITRWLRDGETVPDVMAYVGHRSPTTILRYAAKVNLQDKTRREKATRSFKQFETVGD